MPGGREVWTAHDLAVRANAVAKRLQAMLNELEADDRRAPLAAAPAEAALSKVLWGSDRGRHARAPLSA